MYLNNILLSRLCLEREPLVRLIVTGPGLHQAADRPGEVSDELLQPYQDREQISQPVINIIEYSPPRLLERTKEDCRHCNTDHYDRSAG